MNLKSTLALFLVLAALGGYVYYTEIRGHEAQEEADRKKDRVFDFKEEELEKLELFTLSDEKAAVRVERTGAEKKDWKITAPMATEGDKGAIDGVISSLAYLTSQRVVEENPKDLATYGLKDSPHHISLWLKGKKDPLVLTIGDKSTIGNSYYAYRKDTGKVLILDTSYEQSVQKGLFDLREKKIFPIDDEKAKRIEITRPAESIVLEKVAQGSWRLREPMDVEGSKSAVEDLLRELKNAAATKFAQEEMTDVKPFGFDQPQAKVKLEFEGSTVPAELTIGSKGTHENDLFAHSSLNKSVVMVNESVFNALTKPAADFREKNAVVFDHYEVTKVSLVYPDSTITCIKSGDYDWKLEAPEKGEAEGSRVDDLLYAADALEAKEFIDAPDKEMGKYGLDKPKMTLRIWQKGDKEPRVVMIGGEDTAKSLTYVKNPAVPYIFMVETSATEDMFPKLDDLKKKPESENKAASVEEEGED